MNKKLAKEVSQPFMLIGAVVMLVLSLIIIWYNLYLGIGAIVISAAVYFFHMYFTQSYVERSLEKFEKNVLREREDFMDAFSYGSPLMLCAVTKTGELVWSNPAFDDAFSDKDLLKAAIDPKKIAPFFEEDGKVQGAAVGGRIYSVTAANVDFRNHERRMLFWQDITEREALKSRINDTRACAAYINVDNYDEMLEASPIEEQSSIAAQIDKAIHGWAMSMQAVLLHARSDRYLMIFEHRDLS